MNWSNRVETYLNELEQTANTIDVILDQTRMGTIGVEVTEVNESTRQLAAALEELEGKISQRDDLLRDPDAPSEGLTLSTKLLGSRQIDDARLAKRCRELAVVIEMTHTRAVSLFVCQYHLADLTTDLVRTLTRTGTPQTYQSAKRNEPKSKSGGGLFDEAA
ncbi:hypothetical protein [Rubripirellula reticaptiva]|uniref:FlgN protein n=1 Tax=Rubripirellula reticaptiva TaxID=2528013 RepID=A0A5C6EGY2_9BACT|nr:hypothetical protein [Rubripirellula reticaptiva]TWU48068.1 hypothetical protein Poly59_49130 [Rubripirellula reticaptiva]